MPIKIIPIKNASDITKIRLHSNKYITSNKFFTIHDGPPYANGKPHVGHALNKILKDITLRYKQSQGFKVNFIPGWDCHGLPIELKSSSSPTISVFDIRKRASDIATKFIGIQKDAFRSWGIDADWDNRYATFDRCYQNGELRAFNALCMKKLVFREMLPTYWSCSSKTALAEAELEYNEQHKSETVFVKFHLTQSSLSSITSAPVSLLIWTTTPWTLVANEAVGSKAGTKYVLCSVDDTVEKIIVGAFSVERLRQMTKKKIDIISEISGKELQSFAYRHPIFHDKVCPVLEAPFVTEDKGTGLVHMAPAHGKEDFELMKKHGRYENVLVDNDGKFSDECGETLRGISVLDEGVHKIIDLLDKDVFHRHQLVHSYPYDWRTKKPVIIKLSTQWFIDVDRLSNDALKAYENVQVFPPSMKEAMFQHIKSRPNWCISRQRKWGVPIPVIYNVRNDPIIDEDFINFIAQRVAREGSDFWWNETLEEIVPSTFFVKWGRQPSELTKSADIFDIWFDSGLSWWCTLPDNIVADVYLEGIDQFRGWFSSSLLLGIALKGRSPYKAIVTHGFTVDGEGRKMSKSLGNVIDPADVVDRYGVDVLRYWACASGTSQRNSISDSILDRIENQYSSLRNMFRFIVGNISNVRLPNISDLSSKAVFESLEPQDRYILHVVAHDYLRHVKACYENYQFEAITPLLEGLVSRVSNFYFTIIKDRLYCDSSSSESYRSCVTTLALLLHGLIPVCDPITPCLSLEIMEALNKSERIATENLFNWPHFVSDWTDEDIYSTMDHIVLPLRSSLSTSDLSHLNLTISNQSNRMSELRIEVFVKDPSQRLALQSLNNSSSDWQSHSPFCEILRCAFVKVSEESVLIENEGWISASGGRWCFRVSQGRKDDKCHRCRRYINIDSGGDCCLRCTAAIARKEVSRTR